MGTIDKEKSVIGIVGAGTMGIGVAETLATSGFKHIILIDISEQILMKAKDAILKGIKLQKMFSRSGENLPPPDELLSNVQFTCDYAALSEASFVVENALERWEVKEPIYRTLDLTCPSGCVFAANTSAIPITKIASVTERPGRIAGIHFMNPVPFKPTAEVIRGFHTSDETLATVDSLLSGMGKQGIVVNDSPGFVSNRVLMPTINEAIFLLHEGVASAEDIDRIFTTCFGHKMGPLATADLIGLDTILDSLLVLYENFNDSKFRPCPLLRKLVDAGRLGKKSGHGIFKYPTP